MMPKKYALVEKIACNNSKLYNIFQMRFNKKRNLPQKYANFTFEL